MKLIHENPNRLVVELKPSFARHAVIGIILCNIYVIVIALYSSGGSFPANVRSLGGSLSFLLLVNAYAGYLILRYIHTTLALTADKTTNFVTVERSRTPPIDIKLNSIEKLQVEYGKWKWFFPRGVDNSRETKIIFLLKSGEKKVIRTKDESIAQPYIKGSQAIAKYIDVPFEYVNIKDK